MKQRVQRRSLPNKHTVCLVGAGCVYQASNQVCSDPRINKGNGDAKCHKWSNINLIGKLRDLGGNPIKP